MPKLVGPARLGWLVLAALNLALLVLAIPAEFQIQLQTARRLYEPALLQAGSSARSYAIYCTALDLILAAGFTAIGVTMFWRKSDDPMVLLVSLSCVTFASLLLPTLVMLAEARPATGLPVAIVRGVGLATSLIGAYYLFPNGRFAPPWTRWLALAWVLCTVGWVLVPWAPVNLIYVDTFINALALSLAVYLLAYATGVAGQIYRYRRISSATERQQTRWVVFGTTAAFLGVCLYNLPKVFIPVVNEPGATYVFYTYLGRPVYYFLVLLAPICIGISILRYRLWNIDIIIRRTLIYGILTGLLIVIYAGSVLILQQISRILFGQGSSLAVVTSTLGIAVAFQPLRGYVQEVIDRRFYRHKYDAERVLAAFSTAVRSEVDINVLANDLLAVVEDTVRPAHASLWIQEVPSTSERALPPRPTGLEDGEGRAPDGRISARQ